MNKEFHALAREAALAAEHLAIGVTALGKANYAFPAYYSQAFFALTIGFERSAKLALVVHHAIENKGRFPTEADLRRYGHNLNRLLARLDEISRVIHPTKEPHRHLPHTPIHLGVVEVLSDFANNVTRYYNLDLVAGSPSIANTQEPVAQWFDRVVTPILAAHYKEGIRQKHERNAQLIQELMGPHSMVSYTAESGTPLNSLFDASMQTAITSFATPYVRMYVMQIIRFVAVLISELGHLALRNGLQTVPYLSEFFAVFNNSDAYFKSRKCWSIHPR